MRRGLTAAALVVVAATGVAGLAGVASEDGASADATACGPTREYEQPPEVGGPLAQDGYLQQGVRPVEPVDVGLVPLVNTSGTPVVIDTVRLEDAEGELPLELDGAFVADGGTPMQTTRAGHYPAELAPATCHEVGPAPDGAGAAPYLVLRLAPGSRTVPSQNGTVDVAYHTSDGRDWVAVLLYQVRFEPA